MSDITEWEEMEPDDLFEALLSRFKQTKLRDWTDIAREVLSVGSEMFGDYAFEDDSPLDLLMTAALVQTQEGAVEAMAEMMSVDKEGLIALLDHWIEKTGKYKPIKCEKLEALIAEEYLQEGNDG